MGEVVILPIYNHPIIHRVDCRYMKGKSLALCQRLTVSDARAEYANYGPWLRVCGTCRPLEG